MNEELRREAEHVLSFLENVNDEEGRGIVSPETVLKMRRVVAAIGGNTRLEERMSAMEQEMAEHRNIFGTMQEVLYGPTRRPGFTTK